MVGSLGQHTSSYNHTETSAPYPRGRCSRWRGISAAHAIDGDIEHGYHASLQTDVQAGVQEERDQRPSGYGDEYLGSGFHASRRVGSHRRRGETPSNERRPEGDADDVGFVETSGVTCADTEAQSFIYRAADTPRTRIDSDTVLEVNGGLPCGTRTSLPSGLAFGTSGCGTAVSVDRNVRRRSSCNRSEPLVVGSSVDQSIGFGALRQRFPRSYAAALDWAKVEPGVERPPLSYSVVNSIIMITVQ